MAEVLGNYKGDVSSQVEGPYSVTAVLTPLKHAQKAKVLCYSLLLDGG